MFQQNLSVNILTYAVFFKATGFWGIYEIGQITVENEFQQKWSTLKHDRK